MQPSTRTPTLPGYTIHACIRRTAEEEVFRATRQADGLSTIIKLSAAGAEPDEAYSRLKYELDTIRALDIDSVARALELVRLEDRFALVFEGFGGQTLRSVLANRRPDLSESLAIAVATAAALRDLHEAHFVHTDMSPISIVYRAEDGLVRLANLRNATALRSEAPIRPDPSRASLAYVSPEQTGRMNRRIDARSDLYSFGVMLYELLTGRLPFTSEDPLELVHSHLAVTPTAPDELAEDVPPVLSAIVMKLLAKSPEDRYQTAAGVAYDLERCREGLDESGRVEPFELATGDVRSTFVVPGMLYGREAELEHLLAAFAATGNGARSALLVSGPAGIGKTQLVNEAGAAMLRERGRFVSGRFEPLQQDIPFSALATAFEELVHNLLMDSEEQLAGSRESILEAAQGNGRVLTDILPSLELVIGPQPAVPELSAIESHNRLTLTFVNFVQVLCSAARPLVLFLDDMHNADFASLKLTMTLLTSSRIEGLLLIMAYRDSETDQVAALSNAVSEHRRRGAAIESLPVEPISENATGLLVADMLQADADSAAPLAHAVWRKSAGNPFFVNKLLQTLHEREAVYFSVQARRFAFDIERVEATEITDNLADLLVNNLARLPEQVRAILPIAAAIGRSFEIGVVAEVGGRTTSDIVDALGIAAREDFLVPDSKLELMNPRQLDSPLIHRRYAFVHERVRQAAYSLIPPAELAATHLRIGRALEQRRTNREDALFDIVHQMNAGIEAITDDAERLGLAELNLSAARKAKSSTAYGIATRCLERAVELLGTAGPRAYPAQWLDAHALLAECLSLAGRFDDALATVETAIEAAGSTIERARLRTLQVNICTAMGRIHDAVDYGIATARDLGFAIPDDDDEIDELMRAEFDVILEAISARSIESLLDLPEMTDPTQTSLMAVLMHCLPGAIQTNASLFSLMCCRMVTLSLEHGNCATSPKAYGSLAVVLSGMFARYEDGERFARLGAELTERFADTAGRSAAYFTWAMFASAWVRPIAESLEIYEQSMSFGLREGDHPHAAYAAARSTTHEMFMGRPLAEARANAERNLELLHQLDDRINLDVLIPRLQWIKWLQGELPASRSLDGPGFDERRAHEAVAATGNLSMISHFAIICLMHRYMSGDYAGALEWARESERALVGSTGMIVAAEHSLFACLTACALLPEAAAPLRAELESVLADNAARLARWAQSCPANFGHMNALVEAEKARLEGDAWAATQAYDRAVAAAGEQEFLNVEGIAAELAARMWNTLGKPEFASGYRDRALASYQLWGAAHKVRELSGDNAGTSAAPAEEPTVSGPRLDGAAGNGAFDFAAVVKAANALSGEIVLERLLGKLMSVILEYAGADAGALLLDSDGGLCVQASKARKAEAEVMTDVALADAANVSASIVHYVTRTRDLVVLDDAQQSRFRNDTYVQQQRPRAVLCAPVIHQGTLIGVLYLENTLVANAFTPSRVEALSILIAQLAISIQNAKLFAVQQRQTEELEHYRDHLEELVRERTRELESAQGRLLDMSRKAGMAEVASGVLHNVGNVLNSVNVGTSLADEELRAMRIDGVVKTAALIREHADDLPAFLADDDRGRKLAPYLDKLGMSLEQTKQRIKERLKSVGENLEHVKNIIAAQQGYSRTAAVVESCLLQNVFEAALEITSASLRSRDIEVVREFEPLPEVRIDRHQVLQILVNLLSNASHALESSETDPKRIELGLRRNGDRAHLTVRDNGIGIVPEHMDRIFTHGFTTKPNGHGFGLHNCAIAAQQMDGRLTAASDGPGRGSLFTLEIPAGFEDANGTAETAVAAAASAPGTRAGFKR